MNLKKTGKHVRDYIASIWLSSLIQRVQKVGYPKASAKGARLGHFAHRLLRKQRRLTLQNLSMIFADTKTPDQLKTIVRALFENFFRSGYECMAYSNLSPDDKKAYVQIVGKEHLDEALSLGHGVISLSAHFGNFLIMMSRLSLEGYSVDLLVKKMKDERVEELLRKLRDKLGYNTIYVNEKIQSVKACLASLKKNHVLVLLGDQRQKKAGVDVTFLGLPAKAAAGPISLALSTDARVLPMFMVRNPDGITHTLHIEAPIEIRTTGSKESDISNHVQKYTDTIGSYALKYPDQWIWNHKRWAQ